MKKTLNIITAKSALFKPYDLSKSEVIEEIKKDKYHIYLIRKRKQFFYMDSVLEKDLYATSFYYLSDNHEKKYETIKHSTHLKIESLKNGYFQVVDNNEKGEFRDIFLINRLCDTIARQYQIPKKGKLPSDLEVMYIGQAFGKEASKTIEYRVSNHDKIQKIALEIMEENTTEEILIIGIKTEIIDIDINYSDNSNLLTLSENSNRKRISNAQEITTYEAALIRYFQPKWNTDYKKTFPTKSAKGKKGSYDEIYKLQYDYVQVMIDTSPVLVRIYSDRISDKKYIHSKTFELIKNNDENELLDIIINTD